MTVDLTVTGGAPLLGGGQGHPAARAITSSSFAWKPNAADYGQFMAAVATRYDGSFTPTGQSTALPRVSFWVDLQRAQLRRGPRPAGDQQARGRSSAPIAVPRASSTPAGRRCSATGHAHDTILIGELAARGFYLSNGRHSARAPQGSPATTARREPLYFLRSLYCIGANYKPLTRQGGHDGRLPDRAARGFRRQPRPVQGLGLRRPSLPGQRLAADTTARTPTTRPSRSWATSSGRSTRPTGAYGSSKKYRDLQRRVRLHHQPAQRRSQAALRLAGHGGQLHQLGRVPELQEPADRQLHAVPAAGPAAQQAAPYAGFASGLEIPNGTHKADLRRLPPAGLHAQDVGQEGHAASRCGARPARRRSSARGRRPERRDPAQRQDGRRRSSRARPAVTST